MHVTINGQGNQVTININNLPEPITPPEKSTPDTDTQYVNDTYKQRKLDTVPLAQSYYRLRNARKAQSVSNCSSYLAFARLNPDTPLKLVRTYSCKDRLCPFCAWRRAQKLRARTQKVISALMAAKPDLQYITLTLTAKSCTAAELDKTISNMLTAFRRLIDRRVIERQWLGYIRSVEVTHDDEPTITPDMYHGNPSKHIYSRKRYYDLHGLYIGDDNPAYDTYHPHIHIVVAVRPSYFTHGYISRDEYVQLWQAALRVDYTPWVWIAKSYNAAGAVVEVTKYAAKPVDLSTDELTADNYVETMSGALRSRRVVAYGGIIKEYAAGQLDKLDDIDTDPEPQGKTVQELLYWWHKDGYKRI